jgi:hypothetical protein
LKEELYKSWQQGESVCVWAGDGVGVSREEAGESVWAGAGVTVSREEEASSRARVVARASRVSPRVIRSSVASSPAQMLERLNIPRNTAADLAVHVADRIAEGDLFEECWVYQLRSLAWAALGNARRVQGDLNGAELSFDVADSWWEAGTQSAEDALGYEPVVLDLKASLRLAQRRFPEAFKLLAGAVELFLHGEHRDPHRAGRSLIKKASSARRFSTRETPLTPRWPWIY